MPEINTRDSILKSIRKLIGGVDSSYTHFDDDLIIHINTTLRILNQIGVGKDGFKISDDTATWGDFLNDADNLDETISYVYLQVKLLFDPPQSGTIVDLMKDRKNELEWRLNSEVDYHE